MKKKVLVGFSGGVDSAVAAYLLKKQGYEVVGCFMRNWDALANNDYLGNPTVNNNQCPQEVDYQDALKAAKILKIKLLRVDFIKEYWDYVFSYFLKEYQEGRTPNPDILCNKYIKFDSFLKYAKKNGFPLIAMGHYAKRIKRGEHYYLAKAFDSNKDQTYFLSQINEAQIKACLFPLGDIDKTEVRKIARKLKLNIANKKDSTGVCFIGERHFREFLNNYIPAKEGKIIDIKNNRVVGHHHGAFYYTIGQRKGLGIGGISGETAEGWIVVKKDVKKNVVYVTKGNDTSLIMSNRIIVTHLNLVYPISDNMKVGSKFRYREKDYPSTIKLIGKDKLEVTVPKLAKAVATGQAAVFYTPSGVMIGGGTISAVYFNQKRLDL
ncbi:MAG: tRNA 2-thiouridine(34) synthase MnmA [Bacilli bacterium]|nr:tRNA 2-thiouridine(34) synthase MnmA [Bacilli bacterium]